MHILYLHQYFLTPAESGAIRSYYISKAMVAAGHKVTVITSHNQPGYQVKNIEGIEVHYLPVVYENNFGKFKRMMAFLKFMWYGLNLALDLPRKDLVFATSTPLTVGITAIALKWLEKIPFVFEVRDLWPEAPIQLGYIRTPMLRQVLRWAEKLIYNQARHIIALSPGIAAGVKKVAPRAQVTMLPNMADCDFYQPADKPDFFRDLPVKENFVLSYTGALGKANRVSFLLDIAAACQKEKLKNVLILVAGAGAEEAELRRMAKKRNLANLHFLGNLDHFGVRELLQASDATYTSFDTKPILQTNSPNKFFDSLAAGRICIVNTRGWLREMVEQHRCGLYCDPEDPTSVVEAIKLLRSAHGLCSEYKRNARLLAETEFAREKISAEVVKVVKRAAGKR